MARASKRLFPARTAPMPVDSDAPVQGETPVPPRAERPADEAPARTVSSDRIGVPLAANGAIDLDAMRPNTRARVLEAIKKTKIDASEINANAEEFKRLAETAISAIGVSSFAVARMFGYPEDRAMVMLWSHGEILSTRDPIARVLAKHADSLKYADELIAASAVLAITGNKIQMLRSGASASPAPTVAKPNGGEHAQEHHA